MAAHTVTLTDAEELLVAEYEINVVEVMEAAVVAAVQQAAADLLAREAARERRLKLVEIASTFGTRVR